MKHKPHKVLLPVVLALLLSACSSNSDYSNKDTASSGPSSSSSSNSSRPEMAEDNFLMEQMESDSSTGESAPLNSTIPEDVKLVYTGNMSIETEDFTESTEYIWSLVEEMGGYFSEHREENYGSVQFMYYTIRIPSEKYYIFLEQVGDNNHVTQSSTVVEDISMEYYDSQGRLETQELKMERLQEMIEQAVTMEDLITLEAAISETQWMIDNLSGQMKQYDSLVNYATLDITVREVQELSSIDPEPTSFLDKIGNNFLKGTEDFFDMVGNLILHLAYNWLGSLFFLIVGFALFRHWKRRRGTVSDWKAQRKLKKQSKDKEE